MELELSSNNLKSRDMPSKNVVTPIQSECTYHIFNRGNNYADVFFKQSDYELFTEKTLLYLKPVSEIYAYALLPNHYHFLLRIRDDIDGPEFIHHFKRLIICYTTIINKRNLRSGNLFLKPFRRLKVDSKNYLLQLIYYIHFNPENHGICQSFKEYNYSSYKEILLNNNILVNVNEVIELFDDLENFKFYHEVHPQGENLKHLLLE
jgi:putative transposase